MPVLPRPWRSLLFVPGNRPDRFDRALAAGADAVCMDLEDGVPPEAKAAARELIARFLQLGTGSGTERAIRINALGTREGILDLACIAGIDCHPDAILLPKVDCGAICAVVAGALDGAVAIVPVIESVAGLANAMSIAASPLVQRMVFGSADYAGEVGCDLSPAALAVPRTQVIQAAAAAGIDALDGAWPRLADFDGLAAECELALSLGFAGKPAMHPDQVETINAAFTPTAAMVERARSIVAGFAASGGGVARVDGSVVDAAVIRQASRVLTRAALPSPKSGPLEDGKVGR